MIVLAIQVIAAILTFIAHAAMATHYIRRSRDHATRAGLAVGLAERSAKRAEGAAGLVGWPEGRR